MNNEGLVPHGNPDRQPPQSPLPPKHTNTANFAIVSLVIGILSLLFMCLPPVQLILGVLAIMFAFLSKKDNVFTSYAMAGISIGLFSCFSSFYIFYLLLNDLHNPQSVFTEIYKSIQQIYNSSYQQ